MVGATVKRDLDTVEWLLVVVLGIIVVLSTVLNMLRAVRDIQPKGGRRFSRPESLSRRHHCCSCAGCSGALFSILARNSNNSNHLEIMEESDDAIHKTGGHSARNVRRD